MARRVLIAGAGGLIGRAAAEHFVERAETSVIGLARTRPLDWPDGAAFVSLDLRDAAALAASAQALAGIDALIYAAVSERPDLIAGWREAAQIEANDAMLRNLMGVLAQAAPNLGHVSLFQGTKAYGAHIHRLKIPAKERQRRDSHANFYWRQEDFIREAQTGADWTFTIWRPQIVIGIAIASPMNIALAFGAYAALRRAEGLPLAHPGGGDYATELVDAGLIAKALAWAMEAPAAANRTFNITNGDVVVWRHLWPAIAAHFGLAMGDGAPQRLAETMPAKAGLWRRIAAEHGLRIDDLARLIGASWQFADFVLAPDIAAPPPALVSTIKLRQAGFADCLDSEDRMLELIARYQAMRLLPR